MNTTESRPIGFLLRELDRLIDERFTAALGTRGITRRQWQLLNTVAAGTSTPEAMAAEVSPFLAPGETVEPHLSPLVADGIVDAVAGRCTLTPAGRDLLTTLTAEVGAIRELSTAGLSRDDYARTVATLDIMIRNLETA
ncbi:hypothetical protein KZ829_14910 [Actinoplanes hulinensis]|uniref:MarR family transcriptional regulator n=1 Tax=Actinoplanes hulinensis TaxID=1144547 RepID=A0ABS7B223_9ACTN|nr:hypothetical protein [Actinoplanes hulinensis]MBW6435030.1 hypothetical protein [Actinoplanes hulinensis]